MKQDLCVILCIVFLSVSVEAGTLTLLDGEVLSFETEKEFVEILLEEFLPLDYERDSGYFILTDGSPDKSGLQKILVHVEELDLKEMEGEQIYPSLDALKNSQQYGEVVSHIPRQYIFAIEVLFTEFDMVAVYTLGTSAGGKTRGLDNGVKKIIDAKGEGTCTILEE